MTFLVDNQLPAALALDLKRQGHDASHVLDIGLARVDDRAIWRHAAAHHMTLISKDQDFVDLSLTDATGPAVVWVRLGNCRTPALLAAFNEALPSLMQALQAGQRIVEIW